MNFGPKEGDYLYNAGLDSPDSRRYCHEVMKRNGCKTLRFELRPQADQTMMVCHGYLAYLIDPNQPDFIAVQ